MRFLRRKPKPEPAEWRGQYFLLVSCFEMTVAEADAVFNRVAEAAHRLDEQVSVSGMPVDPYSFEEGDSRG